MYISVNKNPSDRLALLDQRGFIIYDRWKNSDPIPSLFVIDNLAKISF